MHQHEQLALYDDLSPSPEIDARFSQLVEGALQLNKVSLSQSDVVAVQQTCARGELAMETYWSKKIADSSDSWSELQTFPYYENYQQLTELEYQTLQTCVDHADHLVLFCGGGPLPLTAVMLATEHNQKVTVIDNDANAVLLSTNLIQALGLQHKVRIVCADAGSFAKYNEFNTVFVAAMVGSTQASKQKVFSYIQKEVTPDAHILTRSSWAGRTYLYEPVSDQIVASFIKKKEVRPAAPIVNSVLVLQP